MRKRVVLPIESDLEVPLKNTLGRNAIWIVLLFLAAGTAFFSYTEGWNTSEALYFCVVTVTTVGFGDYVPSSDAGKLFVSAYILVGLSLFSTCLGVLVAKVHGVVDQHVSRMPRRQRFRWQAGACFGITAFWLSVGVLIVRTWEGWNMVDCIYWSIVATCTVGYGDLAIEHETTKSLVTLYMLFAVGGCAVSLGKLGAISMEIERDRDVDAFVARGVSQSMLAEMDTDGNGIVDRGEFLKFTLVAMGKVDAEDVQKALDMFDQLDTQRTGVINVVQQRCKLVRSFSQGSSLIREVPLSNSMNSSPSLKQPLLYPTLP